MKGRIDESVSIALRISEMGLGDLTWIYLYARRYDDNIAYITKGRASGKLPQGPDFALVSSYIFKGEFEQALAECAAFEALPDIRNDQFNLPYLGYAYAVVGRRDKALEVLGWLSDLEARGTYVDPINFAIIFAGLGDKDQAFESLRKSVEIHSPAAMQMAIEPFYDNLRSDPRWQELLRAIHYPGAS
jgi:tetratricopeptide (TPR) repeat protein